MHAIRINQQFRHTALYGLHIKILKKNLMTPFLWVRLNCLKTAELLPGDSLILTTRSQGVYGYSLD